MPAHASSAAPVTPTTPPAPPHPAPPAHSEPTGTEPSVPEPQPEARRGFALRHARIRAKLALILLVPLLAIGALATVRLVDAVGRAAEAELVQALATVAVQAGEVGRELHRERLAAVELLADPSREPSGLNRQAARTDLAITAYQDTVAALSRAPTVVAVQLAAIEAQLEQLAVLRQQILSDASIPVSAVLLRYRAMLVDIGAYQATLPAVVTDAGLAERTRAVAAIAAASAHAADAEAIARTAVLTGTLTIAAREALRATQTGQREAFVAFAQTAAPAQRAVVDRAITGANVDTAEAAVAALLDEAGTEPTATVAAGLAGMADVTRYVTAELYQDLLRALAVTRAMVLRQVIVESVAVTLVLAAAVLVAVLLARMLATALRRLRAAAVSVAHTELPAAVARLADPQALSDTSPAELAAQVHLPGRLRSRDEIGDVARALYEVHRTAVHIAAEQAALRTSLSAMFVNLARRSQALVDAMISRLDGLQRDEQDAGKLQQMMALDSLATRMRRNDENLLVLAGSDSSPPRTRDALAIDVLRAAQSEIEQFHRIEFGAVDDDVHVRAAAVNDVVRLVAELLDNAARFSGPTTPVVCEARRLGHYLVIQIEDYGVGVTPDGAQAINAMLAQPSHLDVAAVRKMGIAVVARLAARHGIDVHLQGQRHHGTIATVALPPSVLILPAGRHHAQAAPPAPARSAGLPAGPAPSRPADVARHHAGRRMSDHIGQPDTTMALPVLDASRPGLAKRVPQAQLPGNPESSTARPAAPVVRRPPEQNRDRLTAYQAGVQRARDSHGNR